MFKRLLVPLDGSKRAERALRVAARIARASEGAVVLLQVPPEYAASLYGPYLVQSTMSKEEVLEMRRARAKAYMESVNQLEELAGVHVETKVVAGATVQVIDEVACEEDADLVVLCSHGDTGFKCWLCMRPCNPVYGGERLDIDEEFA